jgi:four helix bundle protein
MRTRTFALEIVKFVDALPRNRISDVMGRQLLRCGTSVGANYRAACRAKSRADFVAKMGIVEEEADETMYWLDLLVGSGTVTQDSASPLLSEADQLLAIVVASIRTARARK